ncbi:MAG: urease accessory protein UreF [Oleispira sp.]|nr:urease accessory protein UreF [Oleispira sp.]
MQTTSLLNLLHISSPALPIGTFAYSQGLEYTLEVGWCKNADDVEQWVKSVMVHGLGGVDLPILKRLHQAWSVYINKHEQAGEQDKGIEPLKYWNATLLAFRETKELYLEDIQVGDAFKQWHKSQSAEHLAKLELVDKPTVACMYALNGVIKGLTVEECLIGFVWSWLENQITSASKAMPMGQTDGQNIIRHLIPEIEGVIENAMTVEDDDIGSGLVGLSMSSALHENQYSRLFRS